MIKIKWIKERKRDLELLKVDLEEAQRKNWTNTDKIIVKTDLDYLENRIIELKEDLDLDIDIK